MAEETRFQIPTEKYLFEFNSHIDNDENHRILFSGFFGSGKTTFLREFFNSKKDTYEVFHLFPVNYQVASNADIFEYIKYDLLFKIVDNEWISQPDKVSKSLAYQFYLLDKGPGLLFEVIKNIPYENLKNGIDSIKRLLEFFGGISKSYKEIETSEIQNIRNFVEELENKQGSIYELDKITRLICESTTIHKENKKSVLIIDDLDRIDPEHIFRILNVFSAHFDLDNESKNKFDFDKIILVCDIQNIRNIFHHKYGSSVDFSGYVDKFYSKEIFNFDLSGIIDQLIDKLFLHINKHVDDGIQREQLNSHAKFIIKYFINVRACSLRDIEKFRNVKHLYSLDTKVTNNSLINNNNLLCPVIFEILNIMFGNPDKIMNAFDLCVNNAKRLNALSSQNGISTVLLCNAALYIHTVNEGLHTIGDFNYKSKDGWEINCSVEEKSLFIANKTDFKRGSMTHTTPTLEEAFKITRDAYITYNECLLLRPHYS